MILEKRFATDSRMIFEKRFAILPESRFWRERGMREWRFEEEECHRCG